MDDAQKRAEQFNTEARISELEAEIRRLRATLPDRLQAIVTQAEEDGLYEALDVTPDQVRIVELEAEVESLRARVEWQGQVARKILELVQEGKIGTVTDAEIDKIFADLDDEDSEVLKLVDSLADDAAAHPEKLGDVGELIKGDDEVLGPTPREERRKIIRKAGKKDRKVLDRLRDHDKEAVTNDARNTPGDGFELWDLESANLIMDWDTLEEALAFVRGELEGMSEDEATEMVSRWAVDEVVAGKWTNTRYEGAELLKLVMEKKP